MVNFPGGLPGVGDVHVSPEYTSKKVKETYDQLMKQLLDIFNKDAGDLTKEDYVAMQSILDQLSTLAKEGDRNSTPPAFLTSDMANKLKQVFTIMSQIGFAPGQPINPPSIAVELMQKLKNFSIEETSFTDIVIWAASGTVGQDQTLQSQLNTFLTEGSKYFEIELEKLNDALKVNQSILDILQRLKDFRNGSITAPPSNLPAPTPPPEPPMPRYPQQWEYGWTQFLNKWIPPEGEQRYNEAMAKYTEDRKEYDTVLWPEWSVLNEEYKVKKEAFDKGLVPPTINPKFTPEGIASFDDIAKVRKELEAQLKALQEEPINMKLGTGETNLADQIKAVLDDLNTITDDASLKNWLMDGQDTVSGSNKGKFDKNLSNAITSGETLNENQKDLLNQSLYKMEQFQKIAGALLNAINQLITSQAKAIARG